MAEMGYMLTTDDLAGRRVITVEDEGITQLQLGNSQELPLHIQVSSGLNRAEIVER